MDKSLSKALALGQSMIPAGFMYLNTCLSHQISTNQALPGEMHQAGQRGDLFEKQAEQAEARAEKFERAHDALVKAKKADEAACRVAKLEVDLGASKVASEAMAAGLA